uniref:Protein kinase domain-containing protein n=1 Tax=Arcella intermedia TaxID=1963864 RepID=A0A6B2LY90_9EUKA
MYILLCGYPPFNSDTTPELFESILEANYTFELSDWDPISQEAKGLISCLLILDPKQRYTASEALDHQWFK